MSPEQKRDQEIREAYSEVPLALHDGHYLTVHSLEGRDKVMGGRPWLMKDSALDQIVEGNRLDAAMEQLSVYDPLAHLVIKHVEFGSMSYSTVCSLVVRYFGTLNFDAKDAKNARERGMWYLMDRLQEIE